MPDPCQITPELAPRRRLVTDHLAASVHNLTPIRSTYEWQDQLYDRTETGAAIPTRAELVTRIIERLDDEHPYEMLAVFALPIVTTSRAYQPWIIEQTTGACARNGTSGTVNDRSLFRGPGERFGPGATALDGPGPRRRAPPHHQPRAAPPTTVGQQGRRDASTAM